MYSVDISDRSKWENFVTEPNSGKRNNNPRALVLEPHTACLSPSPATTTTTILQHWQHLNLMITSMPKNPPGQPHERLSQVLPTVKCTTCLQPVPLTQLGEHTCIPPPPIPSIPNSFIPPSSSSTTTTWLPVRVASPAISVRSTASSKHLQPASSPPRQDSSTNRLKIDTVTRVPPSPSPTHSTFKSSPL